ncbi:hypothetical protein [Variovorax sp. MHTC-1]|uniref:hypothetical protein n=1 Tax=Variovorax sp. MHTC-1 TaxID=2495593 RepID=UPI000F8815D4|nr:hypothetical protein [Variovorax sp. MHTC-1]RST51838.1 hypothetical protein EJI01_18130 [Variovorax sp. MHTC-1]
MTIERLSALRAYLQLVLMSAPDNFPKSGPFTSNAPLDLAHAFRDLRGAVRHFEAEYGAERIEIVDALLGAAHECYAAGEKGKGVRLLRDVIEILFPKRFAKEDTPKEA